MPTEDTLGKRLDEIWDELDFGGVWYNRKQRKVAEQMVAKFVRWHQENPRELVGLEEAFTAMVSDGVQIKGRVDRVERDGDGRAVIIDIKTGNERAARTTSSTATPSSGVYQLATLLGAFERHGMTEPGGAALVQVGKAAGKKAPRSRPSSALARGRRPRLGPRPGRHRGDRHVRAVLPGQGQRRMPHLRCPGRAARSTRTGARCAEPYHRPRGCSRAEARRPG